MDLKDQFDIKELTEDVVKRIKQEFPEAQFPYVDEDF